MADIAYRHPPGIQADNHRVQAIEARLSFAYQAWGEGACPVPGDLDLEGSHLRYHGFLRRAVPRVRARLRAGLALLIPQVLGKLSGQPALQRPRATQLLHSLTPTSASHNNIIIIHHASILSNKRRIHRQLNTPSTGERLVTITPHSPTPTPAFTPHSPTVPSNRTFRRMQRGRGTAVGNPGLVRAV